MDQLPWYHLDAWSKFQGRNLLLKVVLVSLALISTSDCCVYCQHCPLRILVFVAHVFPVYVFIVYIARGFVSPYNAELTYGPFEAVSFVN